MMTADEKRFRRMARQQGKVSRAAIRYLLHPVYEDDPEFWEHRAVVAARAAAHFARQSIALREVDPR
jgi:hypothetical protein